MPSSRQYGFHPKLWMVIISGLETNVVMGELKLQIDRVRLFLNSSLVKTLGSTGSKSHNSRSSLSRWKPLCLWKRRGGCRYLVGSSRFNLVWYELQPYYVGLIGTLQIFNTISNSDSYYHRWETTYRLISNPKVLTIPKHQDPSQPTWLELRPSTWALSL
jgi:hypothetical protein